MFSISNVSRDWAEKNKLQFWHSQVTSSTNLIAKEMTEFSKNSPCLLVADRQTAGRGRGQNVWTDENGGQFLSSWFLPLKSPPQPILTALIGLWVYESLKLTFPQIPLSLKAPNDLYIKEKKVAGILLESVAQGHQFFLIIGFGMNLFSSPSNQSQATCLLLHQKFSSTDFEKFLDLFWSKISSLQDHLPSEISESDRLKILEALNLNPLLKEPFLKIDSAGNLESASQKISWTAL